MNRNSIRLLLAALTVVLVAGGCGAKRKEVTELQRKQAATHVSEAQFAISIRDYARAEKLLTQAVELTPDAGPYWVSLGSVFVKQGNRSRARDAYKSALEAFADEAKATPTNPEPWFRQIYALALLGRVDDARAKMKEAAKKFPDNRAVRHYIDSKEIERMLADPKFKEAAL
jgi:tetratricopeptide (TPR) repeat protein